MKSAAIHWPRGDGSELHGFMAVPDSARGRQPAVLLIGGRETSGEALRAFTVGVAQAGFVACAPTFADMVPGAEPPAMRSTLHWLRSNRYASGRVAAIGVDSGAALALMMAQEGSVAAGVLLAGPKPPAELPLLWLPGAPANWPERWARAMAYLRVRLA